MGSRVRVLLAISLATLLAGVILLPLVRASGELDPIATVTPYPTHTPYPTYTPYPSPTPARLAPPPAAPEPRDIPGLDPLIVAQADKEINDIYLQVSRLQSQRAAADAPLLQLPSTHAGIPPAALKLAPDPGRRVGLDSWYSNDVDLPEAMSVSVRVDVYQGPRGWGYVLVSVMEYSKVNWIRVTNIGPESWRDEDWEPWTAD